MLEISAAAGGNTAIQLGKTAMNADTSDAVLTLVINTNVDDTHNGRNTGWIMMAPQW